MKESSKVLPEIIERKIYLIREQKVMLDFDLAVLYRVEVKQLKRAVKRNIERFPDDFMFALTKEEFKILRCQIGTSSWGGQRYLPYAFTEPGVAMLSSVLNSPLAIKVNIQIIRTFIRLRQLMLSQKIWRERLMKWRKNTTTNSKSFSTLFASC